MTSIRDRVEAVHDLLNADLVTPDMARAALMQTNPILYDVLTEIREAEREYTLVLLGAMKVEKAATRARILAETTPQYSRLREAQDNEKFLDHVEMNCKAYLRSIDNEMRLAR